MRLARKPPGLFLFLSEPFRRICGQQCRLSGQIGGVEGGGAGGEPAAAPPSRSLQGNVAEEVGHGLAVVGSSDRLRQDHGDVDDLRETINLSFGKITTTLIYLVLFKILKVASERKRE